MCLCTVLPLVVDVFQAASLLLQRWTGIPSILGLLLNASSAHPVGRFTLQGTATPWTPLANCARLGYNQKTRHYNILFRHSLKYDFIFLKFVSICLHFITYRGTQLCKYAFNGFGVYIRIFLHLIHFIIDIITGPPFIVLLLFSVFLFCFVLPFLCYFPNISNIRYTAASWLLCCGSHGLITAFGMRLNKKTWVENFHLPHCFDRCSNFLNSNTGVFDAK